MPLSCSLWISWSSRGAWQPQPHLRNSVGPGLEPRPGNSVGTAKLIQKWVSHKHTRSVFLFHLPLSLSSSSPLCCPYRKSQLTSLRLCFCLDLWIEFFRRLAIKYGIEIAPLFLLRQRRGVWGGGSKPPPATTPLCSLFSSERITGFIPQTHPTPLPFSVPQSPYFSRYTITSIQKRDNRNWPLWLKHYICTANWKYRKVYPIKPQWMCTCSQSLPEIFAS